MQSKRSGDKYILNGTKMFITNAPIADILLVFARTDERKGFAGISVFIVEKGFAGFSIGKPLKMMGLRDCPLGEVILQDCDVPVENRLGKEGAGSAIFNSEMEQERSCLLPHIWAVWIKFWKTASNTLKHAISLETYRQQSRHFP